MHIGTYVCTLSLSSVNIVTVYSTISISYLFSDYILIADVKHLNLTALDNQVQNWYKFCDSIMTLFYLNDIY